MCAARYCEHVNETWTPSKLKVRISAANQVPTGPVSRLCLRSARFQGNGCCCRPQGDIPWLQCTHCGKKKDDLWLCLHVRQSRCACKLLAVRIQAWCGPSTVLQGVVWSCQRKARVESACRSYISCMFVRCQAVAVQHFKSRGHSVVLHVQTRMLWCYSCDCEVMDAPHDEPESDEDLPSDKRYSKVRCLGRGGRCCFVTT
jgi:hypothetical protein